MSIAKLLPITSQLCDACFNGDLEQVKNLVKTANTEELNGKNTRGQTALYCACRQGKIDIVRLLLERVDIDLDAQEPKGSTALHAASFGCFGEVVSLLLSRGANPDIPKYPLPGSTTRGLLPREEAQKDARKVWKTFQEGGVDALKAEGFPTMQCGTLLHNNKSTILRDFLPSVTKNPKMSQIPSDIKIMEKVIQIKFSDGTWKERGMVFYKLAETIRMAIYKTEVKDPDIEIEMVIPKLEKIGLEPSFGVAEVQENNMCTFYIKGFHPDNFEPIEKFFRGNKQDELECLNTLYKACMPLQNENKKVKKETQVKNDYIQQWREYAQKGFLIPEKVNQPKPGNDINILIKLIEDITREDVYYTAMQKLESYMVKLARGDPVREKLVWVTKQPRPHDMNVVPINDCQIMKFIEELSKISQEKTVPANIKKVLRKLDKIYNSFFLSKGSEPRPALLRSGEAKIGSRIVPPSMAKQILDPNENTAEGIHCVVRVGDIFFKVKPTAPAYEMAVGELSQLIWKQGTAMVLIVKIELGNTAVVCQAAAAIDGLLLRDFIEKLPDLVKYLDYENFTMQYLAATLYRPLDGKLDNLIVRCDDQTTVPSFKKLVLVCIDSDECFADEFIVTKRKNHEVSCRFGVWLLPQTTTTLEYPGLMNASACRMLLVHSPEYVVINLLIYLYRLNEKLDTLYDAHVITKLELLGDPENNTSGIMALLRLGEMARLMEDIRRAQEIIRVYPEITSFRGFFSQMYPALSKLYDHIRKKIRPDLSNFRQNVEEGLFGFGRSFLEEWKELTDKWPELPEVLKPYNQSSFAYIEDRKSRPEVELESLLNLIDFSKVPESDQAEILWNLVKLPLKRITVRNSQVFNKKHLEEIVGQKQLSYLTLEGCPQITSSAIHMVKIKCQQFASQHEVTIKVINCPNIRRLHSDDTKVKIIVEHTHKIAIELTRLSRLKEVIVASEILPQGIKEILCEIVQKAGGDDTGKELYNVVQQFRTTVEKNPLSREAKHVLLDAVLKNDIPLEAIENGNMDLLLFIHSLTGASQFPHESREGDILLHAAVDFIQDDIATFLIENTKLTRYCTAEMLHEAIRSKMVNTAMAIVYADPSFLLIEDEKGNTALMLLCGINDPGVDLFPLLKLIFQLDPAIYHTNKEGQTALHIACTTDNLPLICFLVTEGLEIDVKDIRNKTPLTVAVKENKVKTIEKLLSLDATIDITHLSIPIQTLSIPLLSILIDNLSLKRKNKPKLSTIRNTKGQTALFYAENLEMVKYVVQREPELVKTVDEDGATPAMHFVGKIGTPGEFKEILQYLVQEKYFEINEKNSLGYAPLHVVLANRIGGKKFAEVVNTLMELRADPSLSPSPKPGGIGTNLTTLHLAVQTEDKHVVAAILSKLQTEYSDKFQTICLTHVDDTSDIHEYAKKYKNLDITLTLKEVVSVLQPAAIPFFFEKDDVFTVYIEGGQKKAVMLKQKQSQIMTLRELLEPICKVRGLKLDNLVCKDSNKRKLRLDIKVGEIKNREVYIKASH